MTVWIIEKNGVVQDKTFTALIAACKHAGVGYSSASTGKRTWVNGNDTIRLTQAKVVKSKKTK